jgi:hypothetical protein
MPVVCAQDDAAEAQWFAVDFGGSPPALAFDHKQIIREAFSSLLHRPEVRDNGTGPVSVALVL